MLFSVKCECDTHLIKCVLCASYDLQSLGFACIGCEKEVGTSMWIYVLLGNLLRGIGETPIQPLGIAYIDDYATEESAAFYIGIEKSFLHKNDLSSFYYFKLLFSFHLDELQ